MPSYKWDLQPSGWQQFLHYSVWGVSFLAILQNDLLFIIKLCLLLVWLFWGYQLRRHHRQRLVFLRFETTWSFSQLKHSPDVGYQLQPNTVIWRWGVFLSLYCPTSRRRRYVMVSRDQLPRLQFKQLIRVVRGMA